MPARRFCLARRVDASSPMPCCRPRFALILWIAILAILWGVAAPTLASVRGATASTLWVEICTSNGTQWVALPSDASADDRSDLPDSTHAAQDHCPYCRLQQDWPDVVHAPGVLVLADGSGVDSEMWPLGNRNKTNVFDNRETLNYKPIY